MIEDIPTIDRYVAIIETWISKIMGINISFGASGAGSDALIILMILICMSTVVLAKEWIKAAGGKI